MTTRICKMTMYIFSFHLFISNEFEVTLMTFNKSFNSVTGLFSLIKTFNKLLSSLTMISLCNGWSINNFETDSSCENGMDSLNKTASGFVLQISSINSSISTASLTTISTLLPSIKRRANTRFRSMSVLITRTHGVLGNTMS